MSTPEAPIVHLARAVLASEPAATDNTHYAMLRRISRASLRAQVGRVHPTCVVDLLAVLTWREAVIRGVAGVDGVALDYDALVKVWAEWGVVAA